MNVDADDRDFQRCRLVVCRLTVGIDLDRLVTWPSVCLSPASSHGNGLSCVPHAKTGVHSNMSDVSVQATVSFIITFRKRTSLHWRGRWTPPPARPISIARVDYDIPGSQQCLQTKKVLQDICMFLDWTNWTFWVTALALIAFGFNLRVIYEQWRFWKIRKRPDEEIRELTQRLRTATERLNKANADAASKSRLRR